AALLYGKLVTTENALENHARSKLAQEKYRECSTVKRPGTTRVGVPVAPRPPAPLPDADRTPPRPMTASGRFAAVPKALHVPTPAQPPIAPANLRDSGRVPRPSLLDAPPIGQATPPPPPANGSGRYKTLAAEPPAPSSSGS